MITPVDMSADGQEPEVQHFHLHPAGPLQPVQVLPQPLLPHHGLQPVHPGPQVLRRLCSLPYFN